MASLIPGARFVELPGDDHLPFVGDLDAIVDQIAAFLAAAGSGPAARSRAGHRAVRPDRERPERRVAPPGLRGARPAGDVAGSRGRGLTFTPEGFFAAFDGPARAIATARALAGACPSLGRSGAFGLHTGECDLTREGRVARCGVRSCAGRVRPRRPRRSAGVAHGDGPRRRIRSHVRRSRRTPAGPWRRLLAPVCGRRSGRSPRLAEPRRAGARPSLRRGAAHAGPAPSAPGGSHLTIACPCACHFPAVLRTSIQTFAGPGARSTAKS